MKKFLLFFSCILPFLIFSQEINFSEKKIKKHIEFLASDKMQGRQTGSKQVEKVARYIERYFKKMGLQPKGYRQQFIAKVKKADSLNICG